MKNLPLTSLFTLIFYLLIFNGCNEGPCEEHDSHSTLRKEDLAKVPYKDSTELTFIHSITGDTLTFSNYKCDTSSIVTIRGNDCFFRDYAEKRHFNFKCPYYKDSMGFNIQTDFVGSTYFEIILGTQEFSFESDWPEKIDSHMGAKQDTILNQIYFNVLPFKNVLHPLLNTQFNCYYNITYGILKIETPGGNLELYKMKTK